ncbi:MAG: ATP-dependent zinc metalloprotease FtsH, partial [Chloroflexota bacterium]
GSVFLGRDLIEQRNYSDEIASEIDHEVQVIIETSLQRARQVLQQHRERLDQYTQRLIEQETLDTDDLEKMWRDLPKPRSKDANWRMPGDNGRPNSPPYPNVAA